MRLFYALLALICLFAFFGALGDGRSPAVTLPLLALTVAALWRAERQP